MYELENKFCSELNRSRSSRAYCRVGRRYVGRGATAAERLHGRIVQAEAVLSAVRIREVRMIEDVEELGAELQAHRLSKVEVLGEREIEVAEAGVLEHIAPHVSELAKRRRQHDGTALRVATEEGERLGRSAGAAAIQSQRLGVAGRIRTRIARAVVAAEVGNSNATAGFEVRRLSVEAPANRAIGWRTCRQRPNSGCIRAFVDGTPVLRTLQRRDRVDLPAFEHLPEAFPSGDSISQRDCEPMPDIEVAIGIFFADISGILRQAGAVTEVPVRAHVVGSVTVGVTRDHAQPVI